MHGTIHLVNSGVFSILSSGLLLKASDAKRMKLSEEERKTKLSPLLSSGWAKVDNRDAIYKEFVFKNFIEVYTYLLSLNIYQG